MPRARRSARFVDDVTDADRSALPIIETTLAFQEADIASAKRVREAALSPRRDREVPRPFAFHWGGGNIVEEAAYRGRYTETSIQLLEYEGHAGSHGMRFCYYSLDGRFQRSPMMIDSTDTLEGLRAALKTTPKLRALLKRLVT